MAVMSLSTAHLDYLLRADVDVKGLANAPSLTAAPPDVRRLLPLYGVGRAEKVIRPVPGQPQRLISEDVLFGMSGYKIPIAFLLFGTPDGVEIALGTWAAGEENATGAMMDARHSILRTVVDSLYPFVDFGDQEQLDPQQKRIRQRKLVGLTDGTRLRALPSSGFVLGIPTAKPPDQVDGALPLDRLIRAMRGATWACLVLAQPVDETTISRLRNKLINELREVEDGARAMQAPSSLAAHYAELLKVQLKALTAGQAAGAWRAGVYLLGDSASYHRLSGLWRAIFSGEHSLPEPVRVFDTLHAGHLAHAWALPDAPAPTGPGHYRHPAMYQTLLSSTQLATYIHLPQVETGGFPISRIPDFDVVPAWRNGPAISLGLVIQHTRSTTASYTVTLDALKRHVFVAGVTGSGKTNTLFHLLKEAYRQGVPFMIIEPAKTEYREFLRDTDLGREIQIFTLGNENISPFRLNPFEVLPGIPVGVHIDLLRSAFTASFGMWTPLPQILEQCLHQVYADRGWDTVSGANARIGDGKAGAVAYPTLTDLVAKVDEVVESLGYDPEAKARVLASLKTRLNGLRAGGKGRLLDTQRSMPMDLLLERPTILELEGMGDDDDRAFLMALLLIRLFEYRRAAGAAGGLKHLLVIEEAHRLLTNVQMRGQEEGNARAKAVESFSNLLAEVRAYGQGVVIVDQVPVKLAPDVIKNPNLKIVHRVVAADDREVLAGAMAMTEQQKLSLATLQVGQAAVFAEGDDAALLVKVPEIKGRKKDELTPKQAEDQDKSEWPADDLVAKHMGALPALQPYRPLLLPHPGCTDIGPNAGAACQAARALAEDPYVQRTFARMVLSTIEDPSALDLMWKEFLDAVQARRPPRVDHLLLLRCLAFHAARWFYGRRGAQTGWSYPNTLHLEDLLRRALLAKIAGAKLEAILMEFRQFAERLHAREYDPYPWCGEICRQRPKLCLYRYAVFDLVLDGQLKTDWNNARNTDGARQDGRAIERWAVALDAADQLVGTEANHAARRRVACCFTQQTLDHDPAVLPSTTKKVIEMIFKEVSP